MSTMTAKSTKIMATKIRSNKFSYFKCIKYDNTKNPLNPAISNAIVTVNAAKLNEVTLMVIKVKRRNV